MANSADPDELASSEASDLDLHCLQRQDISRFSRTSVKKGFGIQESKREVTKVVSLVKK